MIGRQKHMRNPWEKVKKRLSIPEIPLQGTKEYYALKEKERAKWESLKEALQKDKQDNETNRCNRI